MVLVFLWFGQSLYLTSRSELHREKENKLNAPVSQETSFSEWIAKLMHIARMSDNRFSILVCSKWERKPALHLNYIANHFSPAERHSAAVGGFPCRAPPHNTGLLMLIWNVFFGGGDRHIMSVCGRLRKFYGGWLTDSKANSVYAIR